MDKCGYQETCESFKWQHKVRNHDIRMKHECIIYMQEDCPLGHACNIEKIRGIKHELGSLHTSVA